MFAPVFGFVLLGMNAASCYFLNDPIFTNPRHEFTKTIKHPYTLNSDPSTLPFFSIHGGMLMPIAL